LTSVPATPSACLENTAQVLPAGSSPQARIAVWLRIVSRASVLRGCAATTRVRMHASPATCQGESEVAATSPTKPRIRRASASRPSPTRAEPRGIVQAEPAPMLTRASIARLLLVPARPPPYRPLLAMARALAVRRPIWLVETSFVLRAPASPHAPAVPTVFRPPLAWGIPAASKRMAPRAPRLASARVESVPRTCAATLRVVSLARLVKARAAIPN